MLARKLTAASGGAVDWYLAGGAPMPVVAYQPIGAASLADSYLRIAGTGGNANLDPAVVGVGVAPAWASGTGWGFNGTTQFLATGVVLLSNRTMLVSFSDRLNNGVVAGCASGLNRFTVAPSGITYAASGNQVATVSPPLNAGTVAVSDIAGYRNGSAETSFTSGAAPSQNVTIGCRGNTGSGGVLSPDSFFAGNIQAIAIYDTTLTAPQVAAVSAAMAAL